MRDVFGCDASRDETSLNGMQARMRLGMRGSEYFIDIINEPIIRLLLGLYMDTSSP